MMAKPTFEKELRAWLDRKPFQSFVIELDDGEHFLVTERKAIS